MWKLCFVTVLANELILSLGYRAADTKEIVRGCFCHVKRRSYNSFDDLDDHNDGDDEDVESESKHELINATELNRLSRRVNQPASETESHSESENSIDNEYVTEKELEKELEKTSDIEFNDEHEIESSSESEINSDNETEEYDSEVGQDVSDDIAEDEPENGLGEVDCAEAFNKFREGVLHASIHFLKSYANSITDDTGALSPLATLFSVGTLAMFSYGQTKNELYALLNLSSREEIECVFKTINQVVENLPDTIDFNLATNYYADVKYRFTKNFKTVVTELVVGVADNLNFTKPEQAMDTINRLINTQTNNKITSVIESKSVFNRSTEIIAVSAFFFSSNWEIEFELSDKLTAFKINRERNVRADFMYQQAVYNYTHCSFLESKVLQLNLKDNIFDVLIILPDVEFSEMVVIEKLYNNPTRWFKSLQKNLKPKKVEVYLPICNMSSWVDSRALLMESTDLETIYSGDEMRLKGILQGNKDAGISVGRQRIYIELPYEGGPVRKLPRKGATVTFKADYPFIFFICLRGIVLFAGLYRSPKT